jgi:hypothetical protein
MKWNEGWTYAACRIQSIKTSEVGWVDKPSIQSRPCRVSAKAPTQPTNCNHGTAIKEKLGVTTIAELTLLASRQGILEHEVE